MGEVTSLHLAYAVELASKLDCWGKDMSGQPESLGHIDLDLMAAAICDAESRGRASAEAAGAWVAFDATDPNGPDIEDGTPAWIVWKGTVQDQPWIWERHEVLGPHWLVTGTSNEPERVIHGVSHYMPIVPRTQPATQRRRADMTDYTTRTAYAATDNNTITVGTCSLCGGAVTLPTVFMSTKKPVASCSTCGAVDARGHGPTIPMVKR